MKSMIHRQSFHFILVSQVKSILVIHQDPRYADTCRRRAENLSQHTNTQTVTPSTRHSHLAHHTRASFSCSRRATKGVRRIPRSQTRFRVATPRVNPGSEPVQPPRLAGVWTVADTQTQHIPNHQKRVASSYSFTTHTHQHVTTTPSTRHSDSHIKLGHARRTVGQPPLVLFTNSRHFVIT